jgi:hypothetical protein
VVESVKILVCCRSEVGRSTSTTTTEFLVISIDAFLLWPVISTNEPSDDSVRMKHASSLDVNVVVEWIVGSKKRRRGIQASLSRN